MERNLGPAIAAIVENASRLLDEVEYLSYEEPPATAFYLTLMAQEEFAKAFLLQLVESGAVPWNEHIRRATRDHRSKQLLAAVLDHLYPQDDEFLERCLHDRRDRRLPERIADSINIFRHEKVGRWESRTWWWEQAPEYHTVAKALAQGRLENKKQNAIYVRLERSGRVTNTPTTSVTREEFRRELEKATRMQRLFGREGDRNDFRGLERDLIEDAFRTLFESENLVIEGI